MLPGRPAGRRHHCPAHTRASLPAERARGLAAPRCPGPLPCVSTIVLLSELAAGGRDGGPPPNQGPSTQPRRLAAHLQLVEGPLAEQLHIGRLAGLLDVLDGRHGSGEMNEFCPACGMGRGGALRPAHGTAHCAPQESEPPSNPVRSLTCCLEEGGPGHGPASCAQGGCLRPPELGAQAFHLSISRPGQVRRAMRARGAPAHCPASNPAPSNWTR